jgi:DDE superfamily endonuclease
VSFVKQQPLRLMFQDEARFGRISQCQRCWHKKPMRPLVRAMLTHEYTYGAASSMDGKFDSLVLPQVNGQSMQVFIDEVSERCSEENILMVLDGASWHKSQGIKLPPNLKLHFVPSYSPELNPQEHVWDEPREKHFHNKAFENMDALEEDLVKELQTLESNR